MAELTSVQTHLKDLEGRVDALRGYL